MTPREAARDLADQAIPTFPCYPDKTPHCDHGFLEATISPPPDWWVGEDETDLVGMPTGAASEIDVIDVDPRHGGDTWLAENARRLPATRTVFTLSGGKHIYFRARAGMKCSASKIAPGIDVRAEGGYVIRWDAAGYAVENDNTIADWPEWLAELAKGSVTRYSPGIVRDVSAPNIVVSLLESMPNPDAASRDLYTAVMLAARGCGDDPAIGEAAARWAARWPDSEGYETEYEKWKTDWSLRDRPLAGWQNLLAHAKHLGVPTDAYRQVTASEFGPVDSASAATAKDSTRLLEMTEDSAALAFAAKFRGQFVFDHTDSRWMAFDAATGWAVDERDAVFHQARAFVRDARATWGEESCLAAGKIGFSRAVERGCQSDPRMAVSSEVWDTDPLTLGVPGGYVDLRTGSLHPAVSSAYVLRRTTVAPAETADAAILWRRFLDDATGGDASLQAWLQRLLGYALTGDVSEEMLAFFYGSGGNGKGVLLHTISTIMGSYAYQAPAELFKAESRVNREYQLARLDGIRLLLASETESGADLAESFVKEITGNEGKINARHPYGRPFEFKPKAKLVIVGNHAPKLNGRSPAMERRLRVVPFDRRPANPDPELKDKLVAEYPAILRWLVDGCLIWQRDRLGTASAIGEASASYFSEQDALTQWISEACDIGEKIQHGATDLLESFNRFLRNRGDRVIDSRSFKEAMGRIPGVAPKHTNKGNAFQGLRLRPVEFGGMS